MYPCVITYKMSLLQKIIPYNKYRSNIYMCTHTKVVYTIESLEIKIWYHLLELDGCKELLIPSSIHIYFTALWSMERNHIVNSLIGDYCIHVLWELTVH